MKSKCKPINQAPQIKWSFFSQHQVENKYLFYPEPNITLHRGGESRRQNKKFVSANLEVDKNAESLLFAAYFHFKVTSRLNFWNNHCKKHFPSMPSCLMYPRVTISRPVVG